MLHLQKGVAKTKLTEEVMQKKSEFKREDSES